MPIPVGLMSPNAKMNRRIGTNNPDQGYWQGDQFIYPTYKPTVYPPMAIPSPPAPSIPTESKPEPQPQPPMQMGDGAQGEGFAGGRPDPVANQNVDVQKELNEPAINPADLPSLPGFNAPAAPTQAQEDYVSPEQNPNDMASSNPPGSKSATTSQAPAATSMAAPAPASMSPAAQSLAAQVAQAVNNPTMQDLALKSANPRGWGATVNVDTNMTGSYGSNDAFGGLGDPNPSGQPGVTAGGMQGSTAAFGGQEAGGIGSGGGAGSGADGVGGPGAGGMGSPGGMGGGGSGAPGESGDQGPGSWRRGGPIPNDRDGKMEPVMAKVHEGEFVIRPEAVKHYGMGLMSALNSRSISKKAAKGLMGR